MTIRSGDSGRLLLTGGLTNIEGAGGGGLATWATITGYGTRDSVGANVHATYVGLSNYDLTDVGVAVGFHDRVEFSYAHQEFDTGATGAKLGLGKGFTFRQDVFGAKVKLIGDAVYDQDSWIPANRCGNPVQEERPGRHHPRRGAANATAGPTFTSPPPSFS